MRRGEVATGLTPLLLGCVHKGQPGSHSTQPGRSTLPQGQELVEGVGKSGFAVPVLYDGIFHFWLACLVARFICVSFLSCRIFASPLFHIYGYVLLLL